MQNKSKIITDLKEEEIRYYRTLTPQQRMDIALEHNAFAEEFFGKALIASGFTQEQVNDLWTRKRR